MLKDATVRARVSTELKHDAEDVLDELGLSMSDAITLFLSQVKLRKGLPFSVDILNKETIKAIKEARAHVGVDKYEDVDAVMKGLVDDAKSTRKK